MNENHNTMVRLQEIPEPIHKISKTNPAVYHIIQLFVRGVIVTKEEALCQMIVMLDKDWQREQRRAFDSLIAHGLPTQTTKSE